MAESDRGYGRVISEMLTRGKIKRQLAKKLIGELRTIIPLKPCPYSTSGKFNANRLLLYIIGMLLIGVFFVPVLDFYIGYIQKYVENKGMFQGEDYALAVGATFYLIGVILATHIFSSYFGSKFLGRFSQCRNTKIVVAVTTLPTIVIIIYLQTIAVSFFSDTSYMNSNYSDGYLLFIMLQSILFGSSGLLTAFIAGLLYAEENMYDEQTGTFFDTVESPKYNIARANDFWNAFQKNDKQEILRIIREAEIDLRKKDFYNDENNYFQIILKKLPYHCEYLYGYIQGCIVISVNVEGGNTVSDSWDFLFDKADKSLIDSLSWAIKKYA